MKLKSLVSLVFCIGLVFNLHAQILPAAFGVASPSRPVANPSNASGLLLHLDAGNASSYPGSGTTWTDLSGNSNHGTLFNGPTYSSANGGSIVFDGVNDYVKVVSSVIPNSGSFTVSTWAKIPAGRFTEMINTRNSTNYTGFLLTSRDNKIRVQINNPGVQQFEPNSTGIIQDNTWHLITIAVDVSINQMKWYVDSNLVNTLSFASGSLQGQSYFSIGWDYAWTGGGTQAYFLGSIATASVYNRALTAAEVVASYDALRPRFLSIGDSYGGGKLAYVLKAGDPGYDATTPHGLIAATSDYATRIRWDNGSSITTGATATALGTGLANTNAIIAAQGTGSYAATVARNHTEGGYSDWYLPSYDELKKLIDNKTAIGGFVSAGSTAWYYSSSESASDKAWLIFAVDGTWYANPKQETWNVRPVRAF
jgi:hypothetical protein